jgi:hypothetical protein
MWAEGESSLADPHGGPAATGSIGSYSTNGIDPSFKNRFPYPFFYMKESQEIFFDNRPP